MNETTSHLLLMHRSDKGIPSATTHKLLFSQAAELFNVVVIDDAKPHTLPLGMSFFRVNNSVVDEKNIRANKFILAVQCFSPDALDITSACLSADQLVVILTVAAPDKIVQDSRPDIAYQIATSIHPDHQLKGPVFINYVASMTGVYSKADEHLSVEDSNIDIAMKQIFCVLPPGVQGSNAYFNKGRINENNHLQFQAFPFIHAEQFDSIDLLRAGLGLHSFYPQSNPSNRDAVDEATTTNTTEPDLWAKVDADLQGQKLEDYCLEVLNQISSERSKGHFVCFQISVDGAAKQHDVVTNGRAEQKSAKKAAFANMTRGKCSPLR
jgi:hypothetical protein